EGIAGALIGGCGARRQQRRGGCGGNSRDECASGWFEWHRVLRLRCQAKFGGGVKPPNSRSTSSANLIVVRSSWKPPMICIPIGRPVSLLPIGAAVAGSPVRVAIEAQTIWSL